MSETILKLEQIGETCFGQDFWGVQCQRWRWAFGHGVAWHDGDPVFNYAASFTGFLEYLDIRQMTLSLIFGLERTDDPALANMTLQGIFAPPDHGKGRSAADRWSIPGPVDRR